MSGNNLPTLNHHLFKQLDRLSDPDLNGDALIQEISRSKSITDVATQLVKSAQLTLNAQKLVAEHLRPGAKLPTMLEDSVYTIENTSE